MKEEKQEKREHPPANAEMPEQSFRSIQALLDSYPEAVFLMECSGKIVEANKGT